VAETVSGSPPITSTVSQDGVLVLRLPYAPALYNYWHNGGNTLEHPRSIRVYKGSVEIPHISNDAEGADDGWKLVRLGGSSAYNGIAIFGNPDDANSWNGGFTASQALNDPRPDITDTITIDYITDYIGSGQGNFSRTSASYNPSQVPQGGSQAGTPIRIKLRYAPEVYNTQNPQGKRVSIRVFRQNPDGSWQEIFDKWNDTSNQNDGFNLVDTDNDNKVDTVEIHGNAYDSDSSPYAYTYSGATGPPSSTSASDPRPDATDTRAIRIYYQTDYNQGSPTHADQGTNTAETHQGPNDYNVDIHLARLPEDYYNNDYSADPSSAGAASSIRVYVNEGGSWREIPRDETHTNGWDLVDYDQAEPGENPGAMQCIRIFGNNTTSDMRPDAGSPTGGTTTYLIEYHTDYQSGVNYSASNQEGYIDIDLSKYPELHDITDNPSYASKTIRVYYLDGNKNPIREIYYDDSPDNEANGWRIVNFGAPGKVLRIRGNKSLPNTGSGMSRYALPNVSRTASADEKWIRIKYHTDYRWNGNSYEYNSPAGTNRQDGYIDIELGMIPELNAPDSPNLSHRTIHVFKNGTRIYYYRDVSPGFNLTEKNPARSGKETISLIGSSNLDANLHDTLDVRYHTDYQEGQTKVNADQDGSVDIRLARFPELNRQDPTSYPKSIRVEVYDATTDSLREIPYDPDHNNGWDLVQADGTVGEGSDVFGTAGPNRYISIYGNSAPDPRENESETSIRISYVTDYRWSDIENKQVYEPSNQNNFVDVKLRYLPELNSGAVKRTIKVETYQTTPAPAGLKEISYDPTHTNGWDLVNNTGGNTPGSNQYIRIYGPACPDARTTDTGQTIIRISYHTDYNSSGNPINANQDNEVDLTLTRTPETVVVGNTMRTVDVTAGTTSPGSRSLKYRNDSTGGFNVSGTNVAIFGDQTPTTDETRVTVNYHTDYSSGSWTNADQNGVVDISLTRTPEIVTGTDGSMRSIRILSGAREVNYNNGAGYTLEDRTAVPLKETLNLKGSEAPHPSEETITISYHTDYDYNSGNTGKWVNADQDGEIDIRLNSTPEPGAGGAGVQVTANGLTIPYDPTPPLNGWDVSGKNLRIGGDNSPTPTEETIRVSYHTDYGGVSDQDGRVEILLPNPPEIAIGSTRQTVRVYAYSGASPTAADEIPFSSDRTNGWNIDPTNNRLIVIYGNPSPGPTPDRPKLRVVYHTGWRYQNAIDPSPDQTDNALGVKVEVAPEVYNYDSNHSVRVYVGSGASEREVSFDATRTNGWNIHPSDPRVINLYGDAAPDTTESNIRVEYHCDYDWDGGDANRRINADQNGEVSLKLSAAAAAYPAALSVYLVDTSGVEHEVPQSSTNGWSWSGDLTTVYLRGDYRPDPTIYPTIRVFTNVFQLTKRPEVYNLDTSGPKSIRVWKDNEEIPYDPTNGFQYEAENNKIILSGTAIPSPGQVVTVKYAHDFGMVSDQDGLLEARLSATPLDYGGAGTEKVWVNGTQLTQDDPNGYTVSGRTIAVQGDGRLDANQIGDANEDMRVEYTTEEDNTFTVDLEKYKKTGWHFKISDLKIEANGVEVPEEGYSVDEDLDEVLRRRRFTFRLKGDYRLVGNRGRDPGEHGHEVKASFRYSQHDILAKHIEIETHTGSPAQFHGVLIEALNTIDLHLADVDISTQEAASSSVGYVDYAIDRIVEEITELGGDINVLKNSLERNLTLQANLSAAKSRIEDTDFAKETLERTKNQVRSQVTTSTIAHREIKPDTVYNLITSSRVMRARRVRVRRPPARLYTPISIPIRMRPIRIRFLFQRPRIYRARSFQRLIGSNRRPLSFTGIRRGFATATLLRRYRSQLL
jgi:flagellin-like hook-associated protein FlgL